MKRSDRQRKSGGGSGLFMMLLIEKIHKWRTGHKCWEFSCACFKGRISQCHCLYEFWTPLEGEVPFVGAS